MFKIDGKNPKDIFKQLSTIQEIFSINKCEACGGTDIHYVVRTVEDNDYYEMVCQNKECRAKLALGQTKKGDQLFCKRKDKEGKWLPNSGWSRWTPEKKTDNNT